MRKYKLLSSVAEKLFTPEVDGVGMAKINRNPVCYWYKLLSVTYTGMPFFYYN